MSAPLHRGGRRVGSTRSRLWHRDNGLCWRCGKPIDPALSPMAPGGLTIGHKVPASLGGSDDDANLGPEHRSCNLAAGVGDVSPVASLAVPPGG